MSRRSPARFAWTAWCGASWRTASAAVGSGDRPCGAATASGPVTPPTTRTSPLQRTPRPQTLPRPSRALSTAPDSGSPTSYARWLSPAVPRATTPCSASPCGRLPLGARACRRRAWRSRACRRRALRGVGLVPPAWKTPAPECAGPTQRRWPAGSARRWSRRRREGS